MVELRYKELALGRLGREADLRRELRLRGVHPRAAQALVLRSLPVDGRRRTLVEIARLEGYSKGRASQLLSRSRDRLALSHRVRPLPDWLVSELQAVSPRRSPLSSLPSGELPVSVLRLHGVRTAGLESRGIRTIAEVQRRSDAELLVLPGMGPRSLHLLRTAITELLHPPSRLHWE